MLVIFLLLFIHLTKHVYRTIQSPPKIYICLVYKHAVLASTHHYSTTNSVSDQVKFVGNGVSQPSLINLIYFNREAALAEAVLQLCPVHIIHNFTIDSIIIINGLIVPLTN